MTYNLTASQRHSIIFLFGLQMPMELDGEKGKVLL